MGELGCQYYGPHNNRLPISGSPYDTPGWADYWKEYQSCDRLFGERHGVLPYRQLSPDWQPLVKQAVGCMASAWARLAADVEDVDATPILEKEWEHGIPNKVIKAGLLLKARFMHMS